MSEKIKPFASNTDAPAELGAYREAFDALKEKGWGSAADIAIHYGHALRTRNDKLIKQLAETLDPEDQETQRLLHGQVHRAFYSPALQIKIGEALMERPAFAEKREDIAKAVQQLRNAFPE